MGGRTACEAHTTSAAQAAARPGDLPRLLVVVTGKGPQRAAYTAAMARLVRPQHPCDSSHCVTLALSLLSQALVNACAFTRVSATPQATVGLWQPALSLLPQALVRLVWVHVVIFHAPTRIVPCPSRARPASHAWLGESAPDALVGWLPARDGYCGRLTIRLLPDLARTCGARRSGPPGWSPGTTRRCWAVRTWASACTRPPPAWICP